MFFRLDRLMVEGFAENHDSQGRRRASLSTGDILSSSCTSVRLFSETKV